MTWDRAALIAARVLIGLLFLGGAIQKTLDPTPAADLLRAAGLPGALVWPALLYNGVAGAALFAGWRVVPITISLAAYCAITSFFHLIPSDPWQMSIFVKNWAIAGGCLALAVATKNTHFKTF